MRRVACLLVILISVGASASTGKAAANRELTVIHTSGTFNHIQEFQAADDQPMEGGAARWAAQAKAIRATHPNSILVSPGDDVMGTPMFAQYGGVVSADVMSLVKYDAALVTESDIVAGGNLDAFKGYRSVAGYALVNANLDLSSVPDAEVPAHVVLRVNGLSVGVFGLSHERGAEMAHFGEPVTILNTDNVIRENLDYFKQQGVDIVVLLSSLGVERDRQVAQKYGGVHGIDVIVGNEEGAILGDPDDFTDGSRPLGSYPLAFDTVGGPTLVVYAGNFAAYMGELNLTFDDRGVLTDWNGKLHYLGSSVTPDPDIQQYVDQLVAGISLETIVVGQTSVDLNGSYDQYPWQENALSNLWADIYLDYGKGFGAQIALVNAGSTWGNLKQGQITLADLYQAQPYFNWLIVMDLTGAQLWDVLENGVALYGDTENGAFLHVAGMTYSFDSSRPMGQRILEATINGKPLDLHTDYTVIVNGFMADGGDNFSVLTQGHNVFNTGISVIDTIQQYVQQHSPLDMPTMQRITVVHSQQELFKSIR
jgi:5'-nucleotidase/UDP-sugar diphosphatase